MRVAKYPVCGLQCGRFWVEVFRTRGKGLYKSIYDTYYGPAWYVGVSIFGVGILFGRCARHVGFSFKRY